MSLLIIALAGGVALGYLSGGRLLRLGELTLARASTLVMALGAEAVLGELSLHARWPAAGRATVVVGAELLVGLFLWRSLRAARPTEKGALFLLLLGWAANLAVMAANGAMPVSPIALREAGLTGLRVSRGHLGKHLLAGGGSGLSLLSDWIPLRPLRTVASPGDFVMALGLLLLVAAGMRGRLEPGPSSNMPRERRRPADEDPSLSSSRPAHPAGQPAVQRSRRQAGWRSRRRRSRLHVGSLCGAADQAPEPAERRPIRAVRRGLAAPSLASLESTTAAISWNLADRPCKVRQVAQLRSPSFR